MHRWLDYVFIKNHSTFWDFLSPPIVGEIKLKHPSHRNNICGTIALTLRQFYFSHGMETFEQITELPSFGGIQPAFCCEI